MINDNDCGNSCCNLCCCFSFLRVTDTEPTNSIRYSSNHYSQQGFNTFRSMPSPKVYPRAKVYVPQHEYPSRCCGSIDIKEDYESYAPRPNDLVQRRIRRLSEGNYRENNAGSCIIL